MSAPIPPAGEWLLGSGIQQPNGGVARYQRADLGRNLPISVEITGYTVSAYVYLHSLTGQACFLDRALATARFLTRTAWDRRLGALPFELDPPAFTYFFDCGIVVRGLLAAWRATGDAECLDTAIAIGRRMADDFRASDGSLLPILLLPSKCPAARDPLRWSRSPGCYQLKSAMAWWDLAEATGDAAFREPYEEALESSLRSAPDFLPGHPDRAAVMDRLHPFLYSLEGLLPVVSDPRCAAALAAGILRVAAYIEDLAARVRPLRCLCPVAAHPPVGRSGRRGAARSRRGGIRSAPSGRLPDSRRGLLFRAQRRRISAAHQSCFHGLRLAGPRNVALSRRRWTVPPAAHVDLS